MFNTGQWRKLSHYLPKRKIPEEVITFIECTTSPLCVACSGGSDSLALLLLTKLFWSERTVVLLHYNHRIRVVSDEEERQMIDLARQLKVKIEVGHRPIMSEVHHSSGETEAQTTHSHFGQSTTASEPKHLLDEERTTEDFLKTDRSEFLPSEHNVPHSQTTNRVFRPNEAYSDISGITLPLKPPVNTTPTPANQSLPFLPHPLLLKPDGSLSELPSEANLRTLRYAFFEKMLQLHRSQILLLGHHADDRLETVLMRLVRGVGLEGLVAPRALHKTSFYTKVRPLLNFSKNELRNALIACNISFFEDATNDENDCLRNRIRHALIPAFDDVFPSHWRDGFKRSCQLLSEQRDDLKQRLEKNFRYWDFSKKTFKRSDLQTLPTVELRCFFQTWLQRHGVRNFGSQTIDGILSVLHEEKTTILPLDAEHRLHLDGKNFSLITKQTKQPSHDNIVAWRKGMLFLPNGAQLSFKEEHCSIECYKKVISGAFSHNNTVVLDAETLTLPCTVHFWRNDGRYRPLGAKNEIKVKDLFINHKIPIVQKHQLPVICSANGDIAWIPGLPPADTFKVTPQTKRCVFLFYQTDKIHYGKSNGGEKNTQNTQEAEKIREAAQL
jgi:tRNA(Ile)-lysidine synthase